MIDTAGYLCLNLQEKSTEFKWDGKHYKLYGSRTLCHKEGLLQLAKKENVNEKPFTCQSKHHTSDHQNISLRYEIAEF
jgi:hypothetical protein